MKCAPWRERRAPLARSRRNRRVERPAARFLKLEITLSIMARSRLGHVIYEAPDLPSGYRETMNDAYPYGNATPPTVHTMPLGERGAVCRRLRQAPQVRGPPRRAETGSAGAGTAAASRGAPPPLGALSRALDLAAITLGS